MYVPDELVAKVRADLPGLNVSRVVQAALTGLLSCEHDEWVCVECASHVDRVDHVRLEVRRFYADAMQRIEPLVWRCGTAEGAAGILHDAAQAWGFNPGPRPRPTRAEREAARWDERETA